MTWVSNPISELPNVSRMFTDRASIIYRLHYVFVGIIHVAGASGMWSIAIATATIDALNATGSLFGLMFIHALLS